MDLTTLRFIDGGAARSDVCGVGLAALDATRVTTVTTPMTTVMCVVLLAALDATRRPLPLARTDDYDHTVTTTVTVVVVTTRLPLVRMEDDAGPDRRVRACDNGGGRGRARRGASAWRALSDGKKESPAGGAAARDEPVTRK